MSITTKTPGKQVGPELLDFYAQPGPMTSAGRYACMLAELPHDVADPGFFEDHVVCEYWNAAQARWVLVDAQFDEVWRERLHIDHDVLDVPRDRFLIAGDAWVRCRSGHADASKFGIFKGDLRGLFSELRRVYGEDGIAVPTTVYNAVLNRVEVV
jgi:hypothetical protein